MVKSLMVNLENKFFPPISDKQVKVVILITIPFLLVDSLINTVSDFLVHQTTSIWGISFFVVVSIVYAVSQQLLLRFVWNKTKDIRSKSLAIRRLLKTITVAQYSLLGILIIILYQILFMSHYNTSLLIWSTVISLLMSILVLGFLARQLFLWYKSNKGNSFVILSYALAFSIMTVTFSAGLILDLYNYSGKPEIVTANSEVNFASYDNVNWLVHLVYYIYNYSDLVSFILIWGATALLLLNYRRRLGVVKFWIIITLPLIYYLSTFVDVLGIYEPQTDSEKFYYYLYYSLNATIGGILFGLAFIVIAKRIDNQSIKGFMTLTAYGFVLLYISNVISLAARSYPPFGIATLSISGLSSFLLLAGLYSTAVILSKHAELRKSIRNSIEGQQSKLLDHIGMSEVQRDIDRKVTPLIERYAKEMNTQSSVDIAISKEEVKQYINEILQDLHKK